jgi:predicted amidohydrolase YtcJ
MDPADSVAEAMAVRGGKIVAVGTDARIQALAGPKTNVIDLHGRTATPGLIDTHSHYGEAGAGDLYRLVLQDAVSIADIVERVKARVAAAKPGEWISGRGWDEGKLAEGRYVLAADLDRVSPNNPVYLGNATGHYATVNSYALRLAGIDARPGERTPNPASGSIERDAAGHATGVLKESESERVRAMIPEFTQQQIADGILKEIDDLHREGVTAFEDTASEREWDAFRALADAGRLDERVCMLWRAGSTVASARATLGAMRAASPVPRRYAGHLASCGAKIFMDGSAISGTAWSYGPWFKDGVIEPGNTGYPDTDPEVYRSMVRLFHQAGITVGTHAIGDRAIDWVVDTYAMVLREKPTPGLRHVIIHANLATPHAIATMAMLEKKYDAGYPEVQPVFLWWLGRSMPPSLGPQRLARSIPLKSFEDAGIRWGSGSDYGVAPFAPRYGLWASVEREAIGGAHPFGSAESVDVHPALRSYTSWAAPMLFLEHQAGTLEVGKQADIAVWDRNPYAIPASDLRTMKCEMTLLDGRVVYARDLAQH